MSNMADRFQDMGVLQETLLRKEAEKELEDLVPVAVNAVKEMLENHRTPAGVRMQLVKLVLGRGERKGSSKRV